MTGKTNVHYDDTLVSATVTITLQETLPLGRWAREKLGQDSKLSLRGIPRDQAWTKLLDLLHDEIEGEFMCAFAAHWDGDYTIRDADEKRAIAALAKAGVFGPLSALEEAAALLGVELAAPDVEQLDLMGGAA